MPVPSNLSWVHGQLYQSLQIRLRVLAKSMQLNRMLLKELDGLEPDVLCIIMPLDMAADVRTLWQTSAVHSCLKLIALCPRDLLHEHQGADLRLTTYVNNAGQVCVTWAGLCKQPGDYLLQVVEGQRLCLVGYDGIQPPFCSQPWRVTFSELRQIGGLPPSVGSAGQYTVQMGIAAALGW